VIHPRIFFIICGVQGFLVLSLLTPIVLMLFIKWRFHGFKARSKVEKFLEKLTLMLIDFLFLREFVSIFFEIGEQLFLLMDNFLSSLFQWAFFSLFKIELISLEEIVFIQLHLSNLPKFLVWYFLFMFYFSFKLQLLFSFFSFFLQLILEYNFIFISCSIVSSDII
jgi:hypothetical protein